MKQKGFMVPMHVIKCIMSLHGQYVHENDQVHKSAGSKFQSKKWIGLKIITFFSKLENGVTEVLSQGSGSLSLCIFVCTLCE